MQVSEFHSHIGVKSISDMISLEIFLAFQIATTFDGGNI